MKRSALLIVLGVMVCLWPGSSVQAEEEAYQGPRFELRFPATAPASAETVETQPDGLYEAVCVDGVVLKMRRYRPTPAAGYREGRQPVLLFPGILENMNQFLAWTPPECKRRYRGMQLRTPLPAWAKDDPYIKDDPMLYFNLGHFLWNQGYDPWFVNYRGVGRGALKSQGHPQDRAAVDTWITLDAPAAIHKVIAVTGLKPVIGGHSTGGFMCYAYLQGVYVDKDELLDGYMGGYLPHVKADAELAARRNAQVRGVIALDPALIPNLTGIKDVWLFNYLIRQPWFLDFGALGEGVGTVSFSKKCTARWTACLFDCFYRSSSYNDNYKGMAEALNIWNTHDKHPNMSDWIAFHVFSGAYAGCIEQYWDFCVNQTIREYWRNGKENKELKKAPPADQPGYYSYRKNMDKVSAPFFAVLSEYKGLVNADEIVADLMEAKTRDAHDEWFVLPNAGHMNVYEGYAASRIVYPMLSTWLQKVCGGPTAVMGLDQAADLSRP